MITKEELNKFLDQYSKFDKAVIRMGEAISGKSYPYSTDLFETDWYNIVNEMFYTFLESHFTEAGIDWVTYYFFEDIEDHLVTVTISADLFDKEHEVEYHLNSIDELWDFLMTDKKLYFKDAE
jgi:hypothetical protein